MTLNLKMVDGKVVGIHYPVRECVKKFLFACTKWEVKDAFLLEFAPLADKDAQNLILLHSKDFVLRVRQKP